MTSPMTLFLASVRDLAEAETALLAGADIIALKGPAHGALGAVDDAATASILAAIDGERPVSATIGDLPMDPPAIVQAVRRRAAQGVDFVKLGLFADGDPLGSLAALRPLSASVSFIVVVFADRLPSFDAIEAASSAGATGIMLDTADKGSGSLLDHLSLEEIGSFVARAREQGLLVGLAGSLRAEHVPELLGLRPDLLGFRGALCDGTRNGRLDFKEASAIRALIPRARHRNTRERPNLPRRGNVMIARGGADFLAAGPLRNA
jgi:(5-formylfuran-3-yl)methyl phosphate synthase